MTRDIALSHLDEGFLLLKEHNLYSNDDVNHTEALDRALVTLSDDANAAEVAAAIQALYEAHKLINPKGNIDGNKIILGDYFIGVAIKLTLPIKTPVLVKTVCDNMREIGNDIYKPSLTNSKGKFLNQVDEICRRYLEDKSKQ